MYGEVTMAEVKEGLRLWHAGRGGEAAGGAQLGLERKRLWYLRAAVAAGVRSEAGFVIDDDVHETLRGLQPMSGRPRGDGWAQCAAQCPVIERWLGDGCG